MFDSGHAFFLLVYAGKNAGGHLTHTGKLAKVKSLTSVRALYVLALELKLRMIFPANMSSGKHWIALYMYLSI
jgi:hypothetical protein